MSAGEARLYFAYGSNLHAPRLRGRVPSAHTAAIARLPGFALVFGKGGRDGSAKCNIVPATDAVVWGAVYRIARTEQPALDAAEGAGYEEISIIVEAGGESLTVFTYQARPGWAASAPPQMWYRDIVLAGAREHGLPSDYIAAIETAAAEVGVPAMPE